MHLRPDHVETSTRILLDFIRENPLGVLTTAIRSTKYPFIQSSHIPWVLDEISAEADAPIKGVLRGHLAKANHQSKAMIDSLSGSASDPDSARPLQEDVMILFTNSNHHYVTTKFYVETKPSTGRVVPTWNYAAVQVYGKARIYHGSSSDGAQTGDFLVQQLHDLSELCERDVMGYTGKGGRKPAWKVSDAPESYTSLLKKNIIGIEIDIESIAGKFKMSQELGKGDREGVIEGFNGLETQVGGEIARMVKERGDLKDAAKAAKAASTKE